MHLVFLLCCSLPISDQTGDSWTSCRQKCQLLIKNRLEAGVVYFVSPYFRDHTNSYLFKRYSFRPKINHDGGLANILISMTNPSLRQFVIISFVEENNFSWQLQCLENTGLLQSVVTHTAILFRSFKKSLQNHPGSWSTIQSRQFSPLANRGHAALSLW